MENKKKNKKNNIFIQNIKKYFTFYKKELMKKHIISYVFSLAVFFILLVIFISSVDVTNSIEQMADNSNIVRPGFFEMLVKQNIPIIFLIIFAGITPFMYLPVLGIFVPYILAADISSMFLATSQTSNLVFMTISAIIQIFAYSLAMATGIYYCKQSTKKYRYYHGSSISSLNLKAKYYEIRKDEKKLNELTKKQNGKEMKREKLNIKIPYLNLLISFVFCILIVVIANIFSII